MSDDLLSQDEIDALLSGVDSGEVDTDIDAPVAESDAQVYDFTSQDRVVSSRMGALDIVNERFARNMRTSMLGMVRRTTNISPEGVQLTKFGEYSHTLALPSNLNLVQIKPLKGTALIVCNPKLVYSIVECYFGGEGRAPAKVDGREFTNTEMRIMRKFIDVVFHDLAEAWELLLPVEFEYVDAEVNPQFAKIVTPSEVVLVSSFHIELEGGSGQLQIVLPYAMIEPIRELLAAGGAGDGTEKDERWSHILCEEVKTAQVTIEATLTRAQLRLRDVLNFKPGDIFPVDLPQTVVARVDDVPVFRGTYGASRGNVALKVVEPIRHHVLDPGNPIIGVKS